MSPQDILHTYCHNRDVLLQHITQLLKEDPRVVAAWLFGSLGRGNADYLSDIDLWVVVQDASAPVIVAQRHDYVAQIAPPILLVDAPQYAPASGGYLMAHYEGTIAPHQVDWYWQPQSHARIPAQTRLLFDRVGLPQDDKPPVFPDKDPLPEFDHPYYFIRTFWAMLLLMAKYTVRYPDAAESHFLPVSLEPFHKTQRYLGYDTLLWQQDGIPDYTLPHMKLEIMRSLADQMQTMMSAVAARGVIVPTEIIPGVYRYFGMVEALLENKL